MAISSYKVTLKWGASAETVEKIVDIKEFPDLIAAPNMLETTTLSDGQQTFIPGIKTSDAMEFLANYTEEDFKKVNTDANKPLHYALEFSDGSKFTWQGQHTCTLGGKGVDEVIEFGISVAPSTEITFSDGAGG